jgi:hypothetical protein
LSEYKITDKKADDDIRSWADNPFAHAL